MLTNVQVLNRDNSSIPSLNLPIFEAGEYPIRYIEGLNPSPSNIVMSEYAKVAGGRFQHAKAESRNIVLTVGFRPSYRTAENTIPRLRTKLYDWFIPGTRLSLRFERMGYKDVQIYGYVETHESNIFGEEPASQISIICPDPYFEDVEETDFWFDGQQGPYVFEYDGDVPSGFHMEASTYGGNLLSNSSVSVRTPFNSVETIHFDGQKLGNSVRANIYTEDGNKDFIYRINGQDVSGLSTIGSGSVWPKFYKGENEINVNIGTKAQVCFVYYRNKYGGI